MGLLDYLKQKYDREQTLLYDILSKNDLLCFDMLSVSESFILVLIFF